MKERHHYWLYSNKGIMIECYNILDNFNEMGKFPERQKLTKVTQEE